MDVEGAGNPISSGRTAARVSSQIGGDRCWKPQLQVCSILQSDPVADNAHLYSRYPDSRPLTLHVLHGDTTVLDFQEPHAVGEHSRPGGGSQNEVVKGDIKHSLKFQHRFHRGYTKLSYIA